MRKEQLTVETENKRLGNEMGFSYIDQLQAIVAELKDVKEAQKKSDEAQKKSDERQALMGEQIRNLRAQTWGEDFITVRASTLDDWSLD